MTEKTITLGNVKSPTIFPEVSPTLLTDETMTSRKEKLLKVMANENFDLLIIYADKEHGGNFEYLTGFIPRFEEGLLLVERSGGCTLILGNENLKMAKFSRIPAELKHSPLFSLPNQPMDNEQPLEELFKDLDVDKKNKIGLVGWKMFTPKNSVPSQYFDLPYFIVEAIKNTVSDQTQLVNSAHLFIDGETGIRSTNNANEIAHYEYGANLSSSCILQTMDTVEIGVSEIALGNLLTAQGQPNTVVTIAAAGQRFEKANIYPTGKQTTLGDSLSLTTAFKGGLSSRTGFVIESEAQLPSNQQDYLDRLAKPYFNTVVYWLENIQIGAVGGEFYHQIEDVFPKERYHWHLNPGHLVADEEWMSSPIYPESRQTLKSGMLLQIDIIPSVAGYTGVSAEECVALADEQLQRDIQQQYPELWKRISLRRAYLEEEIGIHLSKDVLPLSNTVAYLRPFFLAKDLALHVEKIK
ncbi:aminopeptidase P family N-terminal domain-containing protein [Enterococcus sp. BWM-S5]|uniref:Aminopeptidase P family N-terminal domain-containing protein n=1 Tax=Enterococcus larvae TaxID=2794352 RepID=A0ABS4CGV7_9ENTE|nr:aminopeptidase P family protein [Enterococcus larvae]MBP1045202.1 aminopeptidase P family N-terminal domain-containing protein [Enterococcus larvae]